MENISKIRKKNICISCEGCKAICPVSAIEIEYKNGKYVPYVDEKSCIECGKCLKICYGNHIETNGIDIGEYIEVYDAYVPHEKLRKRSTSGGVISRLLTALIQDNKVDGAFVLNFDPSINKPARLAFVKDKESVYEASSSKYIPGSVFNILGKIEEEGTYAIVGTPCQFYTIKNYIEEKCLESNILYLGLFCDRTMNFNFIKYMEDKFGKNRENLINIDYRNKEKRGWPGDIKLYFDSGREVIVDRKKRTEVKDYFMLERCLYCTDKLNRHADISFGDCYIHGKEYPERTSVIVRTPKGKEVFERYSNLFVVNESSLKSV
ncbi:MAG: Coenzyme F420 hydrogenase/dehydrogenase, beta subunit C-terminal domain, partial [archaeon]